RRRTRLALWSIALLAVAGSAAAWMLSAPRPAFSEADAQHATDIDPFAQAGQRRSDVAVGAGHASDEDRARMWGNRSGMKDFESQEVPMAFPNDEFDGVVP
ncbi:MAG: hypothetical protein JWO51_789, partial [Rhodospirillales bacterium]|nr:hypothetical protein [Rhodospirillales bacterium]